MHTIYITHREKVVVTQKNISTKDRLIFALDVPDCEVAKNLVKELGDSVHFYKLGLRAYDDGRLF